MFHLNHLQEILPLKCVLSQQPDAWVFCKNKLEMLLTKLGLSFCTYLPCPLRKDWPGQGTMYGSHFHLLYCKQYVGTFVPLPKDCIVLKLLIFVKLYILCVHSGSCFDEKLDKIVVTFPCCDMNSGITLTSLSWLELFLKKKWASVKASRLLYLCQTQQQLSRHRHISHFYGGKKWNISFLQTLQFILTQSWAKITLSGTRLRCFPCEIWALNRIRIIFTAYNFYF